MAPEPGRVGLRSPLREVGDGRGSLSSPSSEGACRVIEEPCRCGVRRRRGGQCGAAPGTRGHAAALPHAVRRSAGTRGFLPEAERGVGGHESRHCCLVGGHATAPARSTVVLAGRGRVRGCGRIRSRGVLPKPRSPRDPPAVVALTWWALLGPIPRPAELDRRKVGHQPSGSWARRRTDPRPLLHRWRAPARTDAEAPRPARGLKGPLPGAHLRDPRRGCATRDLVDRLKQWPGMPLPRDSGVRRNDGALGGTSPF